MTPCYGPGGKCQRTVTCEHACELRIQPNDSVGLGTVLINNQQYTRPVIRVAVVTWGGSSCTVPVGELLAVIEDGGPYTVEIKTMALRDFEALPEFAGW